MTRVEMVIEYFDATAESGKSHQPCQPVKPVLCQIEINFNAL